MSTCVVEWGTALGCAVRVPATVLVRHVPPVGGRPVVAQRKCGSGLCGRVRSVAGGCRGGGHAS